MTAEISVMNTIGIALAADSAVTIGSGTKIYNTANKLFSLSKYHPVGIMIYGNANFMRLPWETVIKVFRNNLGNHSKDTVEEYSEEFLNFLKDNKYSEITSKVAEEQYTLNVMNSETGSLFEYLLGEIKEIVNHNENVDEKVLFAHAESLLENILSELESEEFINGFGDADLRYLLDEYNDKLEGIVLHNFENFIISNSMVTNVKYIIASSILKRFNGTKTGVVIAGFGETELYPSLFSYEIEGRINGKLKYRIKTQEKIGQSTSASIIPFAQDDMVHTFIRGIDPDIEKLSSSYLNEIFASLPNVIVGQLKEELKETEISDIKQSIEKAFTSVYDEYNRVISDYKQEYFTSPILSIVNSLPKDELADMAEALVNLTSFKRKVSSTIESVGGPIDVAVITKGDGFVWIKRKHYFNSEKNQQFHQKYFWRDTNESINNGE